MLVFMRAKMKWLLLLLLLLLIIIIIIIADGTWSNWQRSTSSMRSCSEMNVVASNPALEKKFSSGSLANFFQNPVFYTGSS